ncbi:MAG: VOC family protein [Deltaproteobacteria bacterium]|nr:VOC family protein [Deltaproteobacteria bacterium]
MKLRRQSITPHLTVSDIPKAAKFYEAAFGFSPKTMLPGRSGKIMHGQLTLENGTMLMLGPESEERGFRSPKTAGITSPVSLYLVVRDVDAQHQKAVAAGARELLAPNDQFFGARTSLVLDPDGHQWMLSEEKEELSPEELQAALKVTNAR